MKKISFSLVLLSLLLVVPSGALAQQSTLVKPISTSIQSPIPPVDCYTFTRDLTVGSRGEDVARLHIMLQREGPGLQYFGPSDYADPSFQIFTENTAAAVVQFQAKYGIRQTGYFGPLTRAQMNKLYGCNVEPPCLTFTSDLTVGSRSEDVLRLFEILAKEGFGGKSDITFTEDTAARVVQFQAKYGIRQTGYVGPITRGQLNRIYGCGVIPPIGALRVISPNGGESYQRGSTMRSTMQISWVVPPQLSQVVGPMANYASIALTSYAPPCPPRIPEQPCPLYALFSYSIANRAPNNGYYQWEIPANIPAGSYVIEIRDLTLNQTDQSDSYFKIAESIAGNLPPVISGVAGPTVLNVGQQGTWTVKASDPENGPLSYSVVWGDEVETPCVQGYPCAKMAIAVQSIATLTHTYSRVGTFSPTFTVTDNVGQSAQTSLSVNVGGTSLTNGYVKIVSPLGGETWYKGKTYRFTWEASPEVKTVNIAFFQGARREWIVYQIPNRGYYDWTIPTNFLSSNDYAFGINSIDVPNGDWTKNKLITITDVSVSNPSITVLYPNGGETLARGTTLDVKWTKNFTTSNVTHVDLIGSSGYRIAIAQDLPGGTASYHWTVPANLPLDTYRIQVTVCPESGPASFSCYDQSDELFTITSGPTGGYVKIVSPLGGEVWRKGQTVRFTWEASPEVKTVNIAFFQGSRREWIAYQIPNRGYYDWTIPASFISATDYAFGINSVDVPNGDFTKDKLITITDAVLTTPSITVLSPNGGETWQKGTIQSIEWKAPIDSAISYTSKVDLDLLSYPPGKRYIIAQGVTNPTVYKWPVGQQYGTALVVPDGAYTVRVCYQNTDKCDGSNSYFKIVSSPTVLPSITVLSPNGGEIYQKGTTRQISWSTSSTLSPYSIYLSSASYPCKESCLIADNITDTSYNWLVNTIGSISIPDGNYYRVSVCNQIRSVCDLSDSYFSIYGTTQPSITVVSPQANYGFTRNTYFPVKWSTTAIDSTAPVYIELVGSGIIYRVAQNLANTGVYNLFIYADVNGRALPDGTYSIKICAQVSGTSICDIQGPILVSDKG